MKKILFSILVFLTIFNVNADTCMYRIDKKDYTLDFTVDLNARNWKKAYSFNGLSDGILYEENSSSSSQYYVFSPDKKEIFSKFKGFGTMDQEGTCPVLVSIGNVKTSSGTSVKGYTIIPYDVYTSFFALDASLNCSSGCNDDYIRVAFTGIFGSMYEQLYNFEDICKYFDERVQNVYGGPVEREIDIPLLGFFYYNSDYADSNHIVGVCKTYISSGTGGFQRLKGYLKGYEDDFIIGSPVDEDMSVCPLVDDVNEDKDIIDCVQAKNEKIRDAVDNFRKACSEREIRAIESYAGGTTSKFYGKRAVSPYLDNEIKMLFGSFTTECGDAADELYKAVSNSGRIINSYGRQDNIKNTMIFMSLQSYYIEGFALLTNINPVVKPVKDTCSLISDDMMNIIKEILNALKIGAVVLVIFLSIVEIYKTIIAGDDNVRKKMPSLIFKRIIILVIVLLLPALVLIILDVLNKYIPVDTSKCVISDLK